MGISGLTMWLQNSWLKGNSICWSNCRRRGGRNTNSYHEPPRMRIRAHGSEFWVRSVWIGVAPSTRQERLELWRKQGSNPAYDDLSTKKYIFHWRSNSIQRSSLISTINYPESPLEQCFTEYCFVPNIRAEYSVNIRRNIFGPESWVSVIKQMFVYSRIFCKKPEYSDNLPNIRVFCLLTNLHIL